jgi:Subtilase family
MPLRRHLVVTGFSQTELFTSPRARGSEYALPPRERRVHGQRLLAQVRAVEAAAPRRIEQQRAVGVDVGTGVYVQFESDPGFQLPTESVANAQQRIELLSVVQVNERTMATVFVPEGRLDRFENLIVDYLQRETPTGKPKNQKLVESISAIRLAALEAIWTDERALLPADLDEAIWWEVWLRQTEDGEAVLQFFRHHGQHIGLMIPDGAIRFPERTVVSAWGTRRQMARSVIVLNCIAELRRLKETAAFFADLDPVEQRHWLNAALARLQAPPQDAVAVCLLDTGVNQGHPLIAGALDAQDLHTVDPNWSVADQHGHGTNMAGLALYGDLTPLLASDDPIVLAHRLESVKVLRHHGDNQGKLYGDLTREAVARVEIGAPQRRRVTCMALSATDGRERGKPSTWSAAIDSLASGWEDETRRLFILSAGNVPRENWHHYQDSNTSDGIHDPGQSWNALTIGAYTDKDAIDQAVHAGFTLVAPKGDLAPSSCTSQTWSSRWPLKPDVVLEGGNAAHDPAGSVDCLASLDLLTTHHQPQQRPFERFGDTSAATALAARMAAEIQAAYPDFWPETVRGLLVHSASWTAAMLARHIGAGTKAEYQRLVRHCGFGVPSLQEALWSADDALTLIAQEDLRPFDRVDGKIKTRDMKLHELPWPLEILEDLGDEPVELRVTLSYFVEPNPAERGWTRRYRYESHGLRFAVKQPTETIDTFRYRVNEHARREEDGTAITGSDPGWLIGQTRHLGSLHSDHWFGTAAQLAQRGVVAVYPALGWWRERPKHERWSKRARYALLISIRTSAAEVDLYTPIQNMIGVQIQVPV